MFGDDIDKAAAVQGHGGTGPHQAAEGGIPTGKALAPDTGWALALVHSGTAADSDCAGPRHLHVVGEDGVYVRAPQTGDIGPDGETVNPAGHQEIRSRVTEQLAALRSGEIQKLAALIREVDGNHTLGATELAEALIDRGVSFRPS